MILCGQKILITGASRGIGRACAQKCAENGARVVLVARNMDALEAVRDSLPGEGHIAISADLQDPESCVQNIFREACADSIKLTGLVHAAGIGTSVYAKVLSMKLMQESFAVHYFSFMLMVRYFIQRKYSEGGSIVAVSSVASIAGWSGVSIYAGTKGALNASVRALAIELAEKGFRLNTVLPSNIKTDMLDSLASFVDESSIQEMEKKQPLGFGKPEDVANAVLFLLNPESRFITGSNLVADGGYTAM